MTDISTDRDWREVAVPSRLGVSARLDGEELVLELLPRPEVLRHGIIRASVLAYVVDALAGIPLDVGSDDWTFTTDLSVRARPIPAPSLVAGRASPLRLGRRTAAIRVDVQAEEGVEEGGEIGAAVATGVAAFAKTRRRPDDPAKPEISLDWIVDRLRGDLALDEPVRDEAGIRVVDAAAGVVEMDADPRVHNPAGTVQGAMVALLAEAAAEDALSIRHGGPVVVTDIDVRYLARTGAGPIRTRTRLVGADDDPSAEVELIDMSTDTLTTFVYARGVRLA